MKGRAGFPLSLQCNPEAAGATHSAASQSNRGNSKHRREEIKANRVLYVIDVGTSSHSSWRLPQSELLRSKLSGLLQVKWRASGMNQLLRYNTTSLLQQNHTLSAGLVI